MFLRRLIKNIVIVTALGVVVRRLVRSSNPRLRRLGHTANTALRFAFGSDATADPKAKRQAWTR